MAPLNCKLLIRQKTLNWYFSTLYVFTSWRTRALMRTATWPHWCSQWDEWGCTYTKTQTHTHNESDPYYKQCENNNIKPLKHKGPPIRKHTFFHSHSHTKHTLTCFWVQSCNSELYQPEQTQTGQRSPAGEKERECRLKGNEKRQKFREIPVWERTKPDAASLYSHLC